MGYVVGQFRQPHGLLGHMAGWIMANRPSNRERNLWTLGVLELEPHHRVLEIGFGPGYAIEHLVAKLNTGRAVGLDHSEIMLAQASKRNAAAIKAGKLELFCLPVEALNKLEGPFDRIFSAPEV
jgi:cyclopropane fatty-acyl-phospholipid synthase-like methyltransferase